jgi:hypothetical protein
MSSILNGYVTTYKQNSDGTYTCSLITSSPYSSDEKEFISAPTSTISVVCLGILNSNNLTSPNHPRQMLIMPNDNKYIFIPYDPSIDTNDIIREKINTYYMIIYTISTNMSKIPLANYFFSLIFSTVNFTNPMNDSVYNSIPDPSSTNASKLSKKQMYAAYLIGKNPTSELLKLDSDKSKWNDCSLLFLTFYKLQNIPGYTDFKNKLPNDNGLIPDNICIQTDSKDVIPILNSYDCRNIPSGTPYILANSTFLGQLLGASSSLSSYCSSICCIVFFMFVGGGVAHAVIKNK